MIPTAQPEVKIPGSITIYDKGPVKATLHLPRLEKKLNAHLGIGSPLQKFWDEMLLNDINPYTFFRTGDLRNNAIAATVIGDGVLIWPGPYAQFLWYGKVMVDAETGSAYAQLGGTKISIDKELVSHAGGITGPFWAIRAANDLYPTWQRAAQEFLRRRL